MEVNIWHGRVERENTVNLGLTSPKNLLASWLETLKDLKPNTGDHVGIFCRIGMTEKTYLYN